MKHLSIYICSGIFFLLSFAPQEESYWGPETPVWTVLESMGKLRPRHQPALISTEQVKKGEELVFYGRTEGPDGNKSSYISKYFVCTHCHNTVQEDSFLFSPNPDLRLTYAIDNDLPFLQGSTFHGIVNRESWYNGDYVKKYGIAAERAHENLREAIQLCAIECAQGRVLEKWEEDAILAYFWSLEFRLKDLDLLENEYWSINASRNQRNNSQEILELLEGKYAKASPATFVDAPADKQAGYGMKGDFKRGEALYQLSCLHCHEEGGPSEYVLDYRRATFRQLRNRIPKDSHFSLYQIVRYGTNAEPGHRPYMPRYPLERMSHQQVEDLRAYIELMSY